ncbi:SRPBCC family protein [Leptospira adleri]|uniref:Polyketide cyclase n=1 Tax=Leptospira adleri TaxID=2023186 RepID=A0A2M9YUR0_9LEPT|nr:SRPBCC family protein [Leptospira adleri]PJZ55279.1 polyketide cyclase [Leptospira adleri]PJZ62441.1 polyketide cyclase [Leptospira adleri]
MYEIREVKHIGVSIRAPWKAVYEYLSDPRNFPQWASGLCKSILQESEEEWIIEAPQGKLKAVFTKKNEYGIIDHTVIFPSGEKIHNPMRILPNAFGSEVLFSLFKTPKMENAKFEEDANWVIKDLNELKNLMEKKFGSKS